MRVGHHHILTLIALTALTGCADTAGYPSSEPAEPELETTAESAPREIGLGDGYLVWESNRTGRWRLWVRDLAGGDPRQLTPDEGRRLHCCPHISPDGQRIAYLSLPPDQTGYPKGGAVGTMMWIRPDGSDPELLLAEARNYYENRAAVWRSPTELIYIQADSRTALLDLDTRRSSLLTRQADDNGPWLIDSTQTWAASGRGAFAPFDRRRRQVASRSPRPGCQPYFTYDGRRGFWVVAPGGPIAWLHLESGASGTILRKSDPRLPGDLGYLYFPMFSSDSRLLAFAASDEDHPHFDADYEVFVVETDPDTLEMTGTPVRFTHHPATDRFPDVFLSPLPLGRHHGEAPWRWTADPGGSGDSWQWSYGDGASTTGPTGEHLYRKPGRYEVVARSGGQNLRGQISVSAPEPPEVLSISVRRHGREIVIVFDEAIDVSAMIARLQSGSTLSRHSLDREGHRLILHLADSLRSADHLELIGVTDRAQRPNTLPDTILNIEPALWPASHERIEFLWESGEAANLLFDPTLDAETAVTLTPRGKAHLGSTFAMRPGGGWFEVPEDSSTRVSDAIKKTYEVSVELVVRPDPVPAGRRGVILTSARRGHRNFILEQRGPRLHFGLRMKNRGEDAVPSVRLMDLPPGESSHIVITYSTGTLKAFLNGELVATDDSITGGFFHWRPAPLFFGSDWGGRHTWHGELEGVAIFSRVLDPEEIQESSRRSLTRIAARPAIPQWTVRAVLESCSETPTLQQIDPYREALSVCRYRIEEVLDGGDLDRTIRAARWSIMDGKPLGIDSSDSTPNDPMVLTLFRDNPQLASIYLSDTLEPLVEGPLFYLQSP